MEIIHISDLHFSSEKRIPTETLRKNLMELIARISNPNLYFLITGDISFKGRPEGYTQFAEFFSTIIEGTSLKRENVLICPGNHDISDSSFDALNKTIYHIRRDNDIRFDNMNSACLMDRGEDLFLAVNSAYRLDWGLASVNIEEIQEKLESLYRIGKTYLQKVCIVHHNVFNTFEDRSSINNAYELFKTLERFDFDYLLHGHQHSLVDLVVGENRMRVLGVGSLNFENSGTNNGLNHYIINEKNIIVNRYTLSLDYRPIFQNIFAKVEHISG